MDSPIAGVSDEEGLNEFMSDDEYESHEAVPQSDQKSNKEPIATSYPQTEDSEVTGSGIKIAGRELSQPPGSPQKLIAETGKRRSSPSQEFHAPAEKKLKPSFFDHTAESPSNTEDALTITISDGSIIVLPKIPMEEIPAAPATMNGVLSSKMSQLLNEVAIKKMKKEKFAIATDNLVPRHRSMDMWVNKYAPKSFLHLLSDERCNRIVLQWLKSWDCIVFGKKPANRQSNAGGKDQDNAHNPESKILLLNGPPGVGKTTLAHILARQAGYSPMEINASDERTTAGLKARLEALTESQSIDGNKCGRPICVILDEIDGTVGSEGQGAIGILLKMLQDSSSTSKKKKTSGDGETEDNADAGDDDADEDHPDKASLNLSSKRKKKAPPKTLRRPIICICNDLYASPLRPLRQVAQIVKFTAPSSARLIARLQDICKGEGIKMNRQALTLLYEMHHGDIRACVTGLQMIAVEPSFEGVVLDVANLRRVASMSSRDGGLSSGMFEVWTAIFDQSSGKNKDPAALSGKQTAESADIESKSRLERMLDAHMSDMNTILNGCHENYPNVKYTDPHVLKTVACLEALCEADCLQTRIQRHQQYSLMPYIPFAARRIHAACATSAQPNIEFPRSMTQNGQLQRERRSILEAVRSNMFHHPAAADGVGYQPARPSEQILSTELLPSLACILNPHVRLSNLHAMSKEIRDLMERHAAIMRAYGLSYQARSKNITSSASEIQDSTAAYRLEPDIESFMDFTVKNAPSQSLSKPTEVLTPRVSLPQELIKQLQHMFFKQVERGHSKVVHPDGSKQPMPAAMKPKGAVLPHNAILEKAKSFGQAGWASASQHKTCRQSNARPSTATGHPVKYKFNEGVTNAIKRPVLMRDLLTSR